MMTFLNDLWQALRAGAKTPILLTVAVVTIALGTGANTAIFSLLDASLLRPPFKDPDSLIAIFNRFPTLDNGPASLPDFMEWRRQSQTFGDITAYFLHPVGFTGHGEPQTLSGAFVSEGYFRVFEILPQLGRLFTPKDHHEGALPVCLISDAFWRREFQAHANVLGQTAVLDGVAYSIAGVLPANTPSFSYPEKTEVWIPLEPRAPFRARGTNYLDVTGRLKPGVPLARARAEMATIQERINVEFPGNRHAMTLRPLIQVLFGRTRPVLLVLLAAAGLVVLMACANLANLLLARGMGRTKEFAIRQALGARRGRIVRQLLTESLWVASLGGVLGLFLAWAAENFLVALAPLGIRLSGSINLDWRIAAFSLGLIAAVTLISGIVPAIRGSRVELNEALRASTHQMTESASRLGTRHRFVIAQFAMAAILLTGAFLTLGSLWRLLHTDPGFDPQKLLTIEISLAPHRYSGQRQQAQFFEQLLQNIRALPGVVSAGAITDLPIGQGGMTGDFVIEGRPKPASGAEIFAGKEIVTPGYFEAMKIPLIAGRFFTESDCRGEPKVAIISQRMAKQYWPGQDPIGRRLDLGLGPESEWQQIVGVAGDVRTEGLNVPAQAAGYLCSAQYPAAAMTVVVRTATKPSTLVSATRAAVFSIDPQQPVAEQRSMESVLRQSMARPRSLAWLLSAFAIIALLLAAIGIYGVVAYSVSQRTQEIGIRMALGADRNIVLRSILGSGLKLMGIGLSIGLIVSAASTQLLRHLLFGVSTLNPLAFLFVAAILALSSLLACYIPALRAASIDPTRALRHE